MANTVIKHLKVGPSGTTYDIVNQKIKVGSTTFDDNAAVSITGSNGISITSTTGTNPAITVKGPSNYVIGGSQTTTSSADDGSNVFTFNKSDGTSATFTVKNGSKGSTGLTGPIGPTGPQGEKGIGSVGPTGPTGAKGNTGSTGTRGSRWSAGTAITGTSTTGAVYSGSGITDALINDMYLNTSTGYTYKCTAAGAASVAKWAYTGSIKGATGDKGDKGNTGSIGPTGSTGPTGPSGIGVITSLNGLTTTGKSIYAPTAAGTSGYYLKSNGSGTAPTWVELSIDDGELT